METSSSEMNTRMINMINGVQNTNSVILQTIAESKSEINICGSYVMWAIECEVLKKILNAARDNGVRLKCIIEITNENPDCYKKLIELVEIRHLDGMKTNFILNETKCLSINANDTFALQERKTDPEIIDIGIMQVVEQYRQMFNLLWSNATKVSAQKMVAEIKEGEDVQIKPCTMDIIQDRNRVEPLILSEIQHAKSEVVIAVSSIQHLENLAAIGLVDNIEQAKHRGVNIMILQAEEDREERGESRNDVALSSSSLSSQTISDLRKYAEIKHILGIQGMIVLIDNSKMLTISDEADGLNFIAVYSDNKSLVKNFGSLLDSLSDETDMLSSIVLIKDDLVKSNKQLVEANERLKIQDKMQRDFIDVAAHEIRTPIMPILGYAELLEEQEEYEAVAGVVTAEEHKNNKRNYIKTIIKNAEKLKHLTETILDIAKMESGILNLNREQLNLEDVILSVIDDMQEHISTDPIKKGNIKLKYASNDDNNISIINADRNRLSQVISNLLKNAIKFTNEGIITIKTEKKDGHILVNITDTGTGIHPEVLPRLFTKFATKSEVGGTGLGLFFCKSVIEALGGKIWAENNNKHSKKRGATFTFSLPLYEE